MSVLTVRGGYPHVYRITVPDSGWKQELSSTALFIKIFSSGNACRMYFTQEDFDGDKNYVSVPSGDRGWEGPAEIERVWLKCPVASETAEVEFVSFQRRG